MNLDEGYMWIFNAICVIFYKSEKNYADAKIDYWSSTELKKIIHIYGYISIWRNANQSEIQLNGDEITSCSSGEKRWIPPSYLTPK